MKAPKTGTRRRLEGLNSRSRPTGGSGSALVEAKWCHAPFTITTSLLALSLCIQCFFLSSIMNDSTCPAVYQTI
ncbi:hypothetical protein ASPWEDRAFT_552183 [Aspergillus wentii DTO 134E9]|uniref:Uncharacterized protein n=1 Tax=Aspergillus wentii DTO 134E9 TaxID=1073089 RepID=A0A1L9RGA2_ASPWE|nr:uncharacterized protein ASPWEDRAFT_552183 [Aspergillus wentii DTO 134E9]OJJ33969.1 hypothetical protein ASPWEDRAFT_552183 [Aspergillus wentii DTO 134E9]